MDRLARNWRTLLLATLLAAATFIVFFPVLNAEFIRLDDGFYVVRNAPVRAGLTWSGVRWALTTRFQASWHPLTWLSYMLDAQLFGMEPGVFHRTNLLLHIANVVLLFWLLQATFERSPNLNRNPNLNLNLNPPAETPWRSALVAALFALHPLHVEPVAWVACRKDVLSTLFFLATLLAYTRFARLVAADPADKNVGDTADRNVCATPHAPTLSRSHALTLPLSYALTLLLFTCGLMSKAMLVTVPCLLLLLDIWPLRRWAWEPRDSYSPDAGDTTARHKSATALVRLRRSLRINHALFREKVPFFILTVVASVAATVSMKGEQAPVALPLGPRIANGILSYCTYLAKTFWPTDLAVYYPHHGLRLVYALHGDPYPISAWLTWPLMASLLLLLLISLWVLLQFERRPWLAVGWFWYAVTLVPVSGILQVGSHAMADRYTYIPLIGIFIGVVWGMAEAAAHLQKLRTRRGLQNHQRVGTGSLSSSGGEGMGEEEVRFTTPGTYILPACAGLAMLTVCALLTRHQLAFWRTNSALFEHTLAVTRDNAVAFYNIGRTCEEQGNLKVAMPLFRAALAADPGYFPASSDLGLLLEQRGHASEALALYLKAVRYAPGAEELQNHLGTMLWNMGRQEEAIGHYVAAIRSAPDFADAHFNLGTCLAGLGQWPGAVSEFEAVVRLRSDDADAHASLAQALLNAGDPGAAEARFRQVLLRAPTNAQAHFHLGMLAARRNDLDAALAEFQLAVKYRADWPEALNGLAFLLATHPKAESRNGAEAVRLAERACAMTGTNQPRFLSTLDTAYAEAGRFPDAIRTAEKARDLARIAEQNGMADAASARIELYRKGQAYHQ
jgi:tetratricopeptide (TPR) repeat protein